MHTSTLLARCCLVTTGAQKPPVGVSKQPGQETYFFSSRHVKHSDALPTSLPFAPKRPQSCAAAFPQLLGAVVGHALEVREPHARLGELKNVPEKLDFQETLIFSW